MLDVFITWAIMAKSCATTDMFRKWEDIDFSVAAKNIRKLQLRIALAHRDGCADKVAVLQNKLIHSFYAKAIAVKTVTSKSGCMTPGVDNIVWNTPKDKFNAIATLKRKGYKPKPLKRIYIPKHSGGLRPLSIPTMKDRAMQTLYKLALEPIAEITADDASFAYRQNRGARRAINRCIDILSNHDYHLVLKLDVKSCFDSISHEWILNNIPMDKVILSKFIKCVYLRKSVFYETDRGVPQGGCLSSVICNMVLDGLESLLNSQFGDSVRLVRYADDMILFIDTASFPVQSALRLVEDFLSERGLVLSKEKTALSSLDDGFTFLGYKINRENERILAVPTERNINSLIEKVNKKIDEFKLKDGVCETKREAEYKINAFYDSIQFIVKGWYAYYWGIVPKDVLYNITLILFSILNDLNTDGASIVDPNEIFYMI